MFDWDQPHFWFWLVVVVVFFSCSIGENFIRINTNQLRLKRLIPIQDHLDYCVLLCCNSFLEKLLFPFKIRRSAGQTPYYFPEKIGKLVGVKNRPVSDKQEFMLTYEVDEVMTSMVTLQISADDVILIYNRFVGTGNRMLKEVLNVNFF